MSNIEEGIRVIFPKAAWSVLYCSTCNPLILPHASDVQPHKSLPWAKQLRCYQCNAEWVVCSECSNSKKPMTSRRQCLNHDRMYHRDLPDGHRPQKKGRGLSGDAAKMPDDWFDDIGVTNVTEDIECSTDGILAATCDTSLCNYVTIEEATFNNFGNYNNKSFFEMEHFNGLGVASLVFNASFHLTEGSRHIAEEEVELHLNITRLLCSLTRGQRDALGNIFGQLSTIIRGKYISCDNDVLWRTKLPMSPKDIRSLYISGKQAIIPNLPRPSVASLPNHAYVSLKECIADLLAHGLDFDIIHDSTVPQVVSSISDSWQAKEIFRNAGNDEVKKLVLYINEWSDGFEPSRSSKSNRGSCWIKTITVAPPALHSHGSMYTYPIAIGSDSVSHEEVESKFALELNEFRTGKNVSFYHGGVKHNVIVYLELFVSLQDQPERRKSNGVMLGGSKYTARWGYSLDITQVWTVIPPCSECEILLHEESVSSHLIDTCTRCVCWDTGRDSEMLQYNPPKNYPQDAFPPSGKLQPTKITYENLKSAALLCHQQFVTGSWSKSNVEAFLKTKGLNNTVISGILTRARNSTEQHQWSTPAVWDRGVELEQHVDVVMHLLFLGVVRCTLELVQEWSKIRGKNAAFQRYLEGTLDSIQNIGLDWCRCMPYKSGKFGGWVSENYVGACRLLTWMYSSVDEIAPDVSFDEPTITQDKWTKQQNSTWLSIRGLPNSGSAKEVSDRVRQYKNQPQGAPEILPPSGGSIQMLTATLQNLKAMTARIMAASVTPAAIDDVDKHIKKFLTSFHKFDRAMRKTDEKPTWITSYNFICLTNIPKVMRRFGPVRNLWEGGDQGEKIIRVVKPLWFGFRKNWEVNLLTNTLNIMAIDRVLHTTTRTHNKALIDAAEQQKCNTIGMKKKMVHKYISLEQITENYNNRKPLSVVQLCEGRFGCIIRNRNLFVELYCGSHAQFLGGSWYHNWTISGNAVQCETLHTSNILHYCLLLPKLTSNGMPSSEEEPIYMAITSEWMEMNEQEEFTIPPAAIRLS